MIRNIIENLLLFLAPTLIYLAYVLVRRHLSDGQSEVWNDAPLLWLFAAGVLLMVSTLIIFGSTSGWQPGEAYQPPVYKDGKIEPGHVVK
jgi:Family of unknown function (DUF6111)